MYKIQYNIKVKQPQESHVIGHIKFENNSTYSKQFDNRSCPKPKT